MSIKVMQRTVQTASLRAAVARPLMAGVRRRYRFCAQEKGSAKPTRRSARSLAEPASVANIFDTRRVHAGRSVG
jgi:hypothetical protein